MSRLSWPAIVVRAAEIVNEYDTPVTLRQLFYRLVAALIIPNKQTTYRTLSSRTAEARRAGEFPDLIDNTRAIHRYQTFNSADDARRWLANIYRHDRTDGQAWSIYLGVEKNGLLAQLEAWFGDLGIPILPTGGYASQSFAKQVAQDVCARGRPAVLLYAGDFDPSGEDISRDFIARTGCWDEMRRIALTAAQIEQYDLPPQPGKATDPRAAEFMRRHGVLVQVELDALAPPTLRQLYTDAITEFWNENAYHRALALEAEERAALVAA